MKATAKMEREAGEQEKRGRREALAVKIGTCTCLFLLVGFVAAVVGSCVCYAGLTALIRTLLSEEIRFAARLSLVTTAASTGLAMLLGIPAAYALSRYRFRAKGLIDTLVDLPMVFPAVASGFALLLLFGYYLGDVFRHWGWRVPHTQHGIVIAQFFCIMTLAVRTVKAAFDSINPRFAQVARTLGSGEWRVFWRITLPLARNGILAGAVMTWAYALGLFGPVMMFCGATRMRTEVLPVAVYLNNAVGQLEAAAAATLILLAIAVASLLLFKRLGGRGFLW